jgi:hypothetical protein
VTLILEITCVFQQSVSDSDFGAVKSDLQDLVISDFQQLFRFQFRLSVEENFVFGK